jgi:pimeloyl-ACP methyl ester carboxylesterase
VANHKYLLLILGILAAFTYCCSDNNSSDNEPDASVDAGEPVVDGTDGGDGAGDRIANDAGDAGSGDEGAEEVEWLACSLYPDLGPQREAECAMIEVPLRHDEPDGPRIEIWVQRLLGTVAERRGQIWFLEGGPGGSGADFAPFFDYFSDLVPEWDLYTLDHRGVGFSARLGCPQQELAGSEAGFSITSGEWADCLQHMQDTWGSDLAEFSTTAAALDLGMIIDRVSAPGEDVHVLGVSYGTYWAIRYLQLYPQQASGVVLDSIAPPGISFLKYDVFFNDIGEDFIEYCKNDALCVSKLGVDPWTTIGQVFTNVQAGSCPAFSDLLGAGAERFYLRLSLGLLLKNIAMRPFIPATIYRLNRCDPEDVAALRQLLTTLFSQPDGPSAYDRRGSTSLFYNVGLSELWEDPLPDPADVDSMVTPLYMAVDLAPRMAAKQDTWPLYPRDRYVHNWPETQIPILMMNGDLDPQTPPWVAEPAVNYFTGAHHYYFEFPRCPHGVITHSPVQTPGRQPCGVQMLIDFIDNPASAPDSACLTDILPIDFSGVPEHSQYLFGTEDMWENDDRKRVSTPAQKPPDFDRTVRWIRSTVEPPKFIK